MPAFERGDVVTCASGKRFVVWNWPDCFAVVEDRGPRHRSDAILEAGLRWVRVQCVRTKTLIEAKLQFHLTHAAIIAIAAAITREAIARSFEAKYANAIAPDMPHIARSGGRQVGAHRAV